MYGRMNRPLGNLQPATVFEYKGPGGVVLDFPMTAEAAQRVRNQQGLSGISDIIGAIGSAYSASKTAGAAEKAASTSAAARIAEAQANVEAARLALQAEALKAQSKGKGGILTSTPVMIGGAVALTGLLAFLIMRRKRRGG